MQSECLDDTTLIECAKTKSQEHLLAIAQRRSLSELVTEVLVERGDQQVLLRAAMNGGALFSEDSFGKLVEHANGDDALGSCVGVRPDLPPALLDKLLEMASEAVRAKLKSERHYDARAIEKAVSDAAAKMRDEPPTKLTRQAAAQLVDRLNRAGQLNRDKLIEFSMGHRHEVLIAALAFMAHVPTTIVEKIVDDPADETLFALTKVIGLSWQETSIIVTSRPSDQLFIANGVEEFRAAYLRMKPETARQILDFHCARGISLH
jgi:uncharacterized protein (DUF2336 family)